MAAVSSRYARALADVVVEKRLDAEKTLAELADVAQLLESSHELRVVWENPAIAADQKRKLLDAIAQRAGLSQPVRNLVAVVIDHRRVGLLPDIAQHARTELNQRLGIAEASVTSARVLGDDEKKELEARIAAATGQKVRAKYTTDPALLGGALVRIGSTIYDGSVRGQLRKLKETLSS